MRHLMLLFEKFDIATLSANYDITAYYSSHFRFDKALFCCTVLGAFALVIFQATKRKQALLCYGSKLLLLKWMDGQYDFALPAVLSL